ncbi:MAG TPA: FGGY family carbohydrate kinase, partial [Deinococcales bacterium]|nr:FGGY family carbohydrate kinase [Deinococcales bacterium]
MKVLLCDSAGSVRAEAAAGYPVLTPGPGRAESRPADWWNAVVSAVRQLPAAERRLVQAVGLSGQMHGLVVTGPDGTALRNAILWSDTRSVPQLERYRALPQHLQRTLGNPLVTGMAGPGLLWFQDQEPQLLDRARHALQPKDWLRL